MIAKADNFPRSGRNHKLDLLRILFATAVVLAHAPEITDGNSRRELLTRLLHTPFNFGDLGVDGFFLLSGYLIVKSWLLEPEAVNFFRKRFLRILPGYFVAAILSTLVVGLLAPGIAAFFRHITSHFFISLLMVGKLNTPPVFPGMQFTNVNESLWTIPYELRCYVLVALFGLTGLLRRPVFWLATTALLFLLMLIHPLAWSSPWHKIYFLTGEPRDIVRLGSAFFVGGCFHLFRHLIGFRTSLAAGAAFTILLVAIFRADYIEPTVVLFGGYLMFFLGQAPSITFSWMKRIPDISYGVYLYGTPIETLWIWYHRSGSPWITFAVSSAIAFVIGWLSWHFVERPMLTLKRKPSAPLPHS